MDDLLKSWGFSEEICQKFAGKFSFKFKEVFIYNYNSINFDSDK